MAIARYLSWVLALGTPLVIFTGCEQVESAELGRHLFTDPNLSANRDQSCATCHSRDTGGTGSESLLNAHGAVYEGSVKGRFGNRKPPASSYATLAPRFTYDPANGFVGGNFWDGRATGWKLGTPAADQAQGPFLNPVEQALPNAAELVARVCNGDYGGLFRRVWGHDACKDENAGYASIALSISEFEGSPETNRFDSKYDFVVNDKARFSALEARGSELFKGQAKCSSCHAVGGSGRGAAFTDFSFDNLGIPRNPENPFYAMDQVLIDGEPINPLGSNWLDPGLAGFIETLASDGAWRALPYVTPNLAEMSGAQLTSLVPTSRGKHRVPTLRNVDKRPGAGWVKAYGHNGYFKSLRGIVHFYNTRDALPTCETSVTEAEALANNCWPAPEIPENVNHESVGNLGLSAADEDALVAFMSTLSDGWLEATLR